jgi:uncharacterized membrane protein YdjX (TVP38/TMEM64 family)
LSDARKNILIKMALVAAVALAIVLFFVFDLDRYLTLSYLKQTREQFQSVYADNALLVLGAFFLVYVLATALSLPGAAVLTLAAGALFGFWTGLVLVSFASTIGATLAFLFARFLLRDWVQNKFGTRLNKINQGVEREGAFYLFTLRLIPVFPFWLINLAMALTPIRTRTFYWVSQVGMLPGTAVFVNAGKQLGAIETLGQILSWEIVLSFALLGVFPLAAKKLLSFTAAKQENPKNPFRKEVEMASYDYDIGVIGSGAAGLTVTAGAARLGVKTLLVEKEGRLGGDCLHYGCVPSKTLIKTAKVYHQIRTSENYGLPKVDAPPVDFRAVRERILSVIGTIQKHDSVERFCSLGAKVEFGTASFVDEHVIEVDGKRISAAKWVVATGSRPSMPPIQGLSKTPVLTNMDIFYMNSLPGHLIILGAGPIAVEMAQAFVRLGSNVTVIQRSDRI